MDEQREQKHLEAEFEDIQKDLDNDEVFLKSFENSDSPIKTLFSIYKGNYGRIIKSTVFYCLKYIPVIIKPILTAALIDLAVEAVTAGVEPDWTRMILFFIGALVLTLLNVPFNYWHTKNYSKAIRSVEAGLRSNMVRKLQHLTISFHREMQSGRVQSKIMRDVEAVEELSTMLFTNYLGVLLSLLAALIITAIKNLTVFLSFLLLVPIAVAIMMAFKNSIKKRNAEFRHEIESTSATVIEMVELIPVTKAHALENEETAKVNTRLKEVAKRGYALDILQSFFGSINWASFQTFQLICLIFTVVLAFRGTISVGDITLYQSYFTTVVSDVCAAINLIPIMTKGFESVKSIGDIMGAYNVEVTEGKTKISKLDGQYEFKNVNFDFETATGTLHVINDLNLKVNKGETIALVGESGSGKSTILNLVIGFYQSKSGSVTVDGVDMKDIDLHSYRQHIAMVPQTSILFSGTIRENITFGSDVSDEELWTAIRAANLEDMINNLPKGLDTQVGEHGDKLSGGQRQRISIARAIIRKPDVIIFDEATSALDTVSEKLIQESIDNLCRDKTTFIVAHRLSTIRGADKIAVISGGKCVEYGTYAELMEKKGEFYKFKSLQV